jgi:maltooligosyltrehalose trehalohydrolase
VSRFYLAVCRSLYMSTSGLSLMSFGPTLESDAVTFRLWAPSHGVVSLELDGVDELIPLQRQPDGWHQCTTVRARAGSLYRFVLPGGLRVPDPASRFQPRDVHGPSEVTDPSGFSWSDGDWSGRPWEQAVIYELHVGAFTPAGTFRAVIDKLDHLQRLGVTALELMPIADFPGGRNWGYDGVCLFAPDSSYGRPEELKALIDAAHQRRMMVLLDVVYNHFGPEGAYIHSIAPESFTDRHRTPWGAGINTDGPSCAAVRELFVQNALYWIQEFHFDGLRLDAVHAIVDEGPRHLLEELAERARAAAAGRQVHLILENEENQARRLMRSTDNQPLSYTAQWNDDAHHVLHVAATDEAAGYYADYHGDTAKLGRALAEGFAFQGELMPYRGESRGEPSGHLPPTAFVAFLQNHDQIGNRAFGERLTALATQSAVRAATAIYLLLPQIPMLFMGEEWGALQPFPFFCDFGVELADAVRKGRRDEFARFPQFQDPQVRERIPDPTAERTFLSAKLNWSDLDQQSHSGCLEWYRRLLAVRTEEIIPLLPKIKRGGTFTVMGETAVRVCWVMEKSDETLVLDANLSSHPARFPNENRRILWEEGVLNPPEEFAGYTVRWSIGRAAG